MSKRALTAAAVERLKPPSAGQVQHFDSGYPGLALRISHGGAKAWTFKYRISGQQRLMTLGAWPGMSLAEAREAWRGARKSIALGHDPGRALREKKADTFEAVLAQWLKRDQSDNRSHDEVKRILEKDALPAWRNRRVAEINRRQVLDLVDGIADRGAKTLARRVHAHLHRLFRWATGRGIITANPIAELPKPGSEMKRDRVLSEQELALAWRAAEGLGWPFGPIYRLLILTGARREEIGALRWSEIDRDRRETQLAGERTKNGEPHTIPLSDQALAIIDDLPQLGNGELVFTTTAEGKMANPVSGWSKAKTRLDSRMLELARQDAVDRGEPAATIARVSIPPWRTHDLRRTVATGLQRLRIGLQVIEAILGHVSGSRAGIVGVYQRHEFTEEKRQALDAWGRFVEELAAGKPANVVNADVRRRRGRRSAGR